MTKKPQTGARSSCPICVALERVGDAWSLLVVRGLMLEGCQSFKDLLGAEEGIASNILSDRLQRLETSGIIVAARSGRRAPTACAISIGSRRRMRACRVSSCSTTMHVTTKLAPGSRRGDEMEASPRSCTCWKASRRRRSA